MSVASGCALRRRAATAPADTDQERPASPPQDTLESYISKVRHLAANARPEPKTRARTVESGDPELASALAKAAASPTPANHRIAAEAYGRTGVLDQAYDHFARAVRLDSSDAAAYDGLARIWRDWGYPHLGLGDAHRAVYYAPKSASAHNTLGTLLQALGHLRDARAEYQRALALDPRAAYALSNLGYLLLQDGKAAAAAAACRRAVELDPSLRAARNNLALAYAALGDLESARREFLLAGDLAAGEYNMGLAYLMNGQPAKAAGAFEAARILRPSLARAGARARQARLLATQEEMQEPPHDRP